MLKTLFKIRIKMMINSMFGRKKTSGLKTGLAVALSIYMFVVFTSLFVGLFTILSHTYFKMGIGWLYFGFGGLMAFILCFSGSVFIAQQQIYESKDNDLLLSMPINTGSIFLSRMLSILFINALYTLPILIGSILGYVIIHGFAVFIIIKSIIAYGLIVLFSTAITIAFALLLALVSTGLRKKNVITLVASLIFFILYFGFLLNSQKMMMTIAEKGQTIGEAMKSFGFLFYIMGNAVYESNLLYMLAFVAVCIVPFLIMYLVLTQSYIKIITTNRGGKKKEYKEKNIKTQGAFGAMLYKEFRHMANMPTYILNFMFMPLFTIIGAGYLVVKKDSLNDVVASLSSYGIDGVYILGLVACLVITMSSLILGSMTSASINIEGKNIWILQTLPTRGSTILLSKLALPFILGIPFILVTGIISIFVLKTDLLVSILMIFVPILGLFLTANFGLYINLIYYRLDWTNENYAVKNAAAPMITSFGTIGFLVFLGIIYLIINKIVSLENYMIATGIIVLLADIVFATILMKKGEKLLKKIN